MECSQKCFTVTNMSATSAVATCLLFSFIFLNFYNKNQVSSQEVDPIQCIADVQKVISIMQRSR